MIEVSKKGFLNSVVGLTLRWIVFIPVGILILYLLQALILVIFTWVYRDFRGIVILGILLGTLFTVLPLVIYAYYGAIYFINKVICPNHKVGVLIFATIFSLMEILNLFLMVSSSSWGFAFWKVVFYAVALISFVTIYNEKS